MHGEAEQSAEFNADTAMDALLAFSESCSALHDMTQSDTDIVITITPKTGGARTIELHAEAIPRDMAIGFAQQVEWDYGGEQSDLGRKIHAYPEQARPAARGALDSNIKLRYQLLSVQNEANNFKTAYPAIQGITVTVDGVELNELLAEKSEDYPGLLCKVADIDQAAQNEADAQWQAIQSELETAIGSEEMANIKAILQSVNDFRSQNPHFACGFTSAQSGEMITGLEVLECPQAMKDALGTYIRNLAKPFAEVAAHAHGLVKNWEGLLTPPPVTDTAPQTLPSVPVAQEPTLAEEFSNYYHRLHSMRPQTSLEWSSWVYQLSRLADMMTRHKELSSMDVSWPTLVENINIADIPGDLPADQRLYLQQNLKQMRTGKQPTKLNFVSFRSQQMRDLTRDENLAYVVAAGGAEIAEFCAEFLNLLTKDPYLSYDPKKIQGFLTNVEHAQHSQNGATFLKEKVFPPLKRLLLAKQAILTADTPEAYQTAADVYYRGIERLSKNIGAQLVSSYHTACGTPLDTVVANPELAGRSGVAETPSLVTRS